MDKFCQIITELLPLIHKKNWHQCSILDIFWLIVYKLCMQVDIWEEWSGIVDGQISSNKHRTIALDLCGKLVLVLDLEHYSINFLQTLHVS